MVECGGSVESIKSHSLREAAQESGGTAADISVLLRAEG